MLGPFRERIIIGVPVVMAGRTTEAQKHGRVTMQFLQKIFIGIIALSYVLYSLTQSKIVW